MFKRSALCAILTCLPALSGGKEPEALPRSALTHLQEDLRAAATRAKLSEADRKAFEMASRDIAKLTERDRRRSASILNALEPFLENPGLTAEDRAALRQDLKALHAAIADDPSTDTRARHRLRDAIQPDRADAASYPMPTSSSPPAAGDNSAHGGWRRAPQP